MSKCLGLAEPALVGRDRELRELQHFLELVTEGRGKTVFISAEAGMGKTRVLRDFLQNASKQKNIVTLSGWCLVNSGIPYFPFIEAFSNFYSSGREKEDLEPNSWLTGTAKADLSDKLDYISPQTLKDQTFSAVAKTIHSMAAQNTVILVIEDIHWADSASLALIHYIARVINNSEKVLVLATFRSDELTSDGEGYPHKLVETLCMMRREDLFREIKLVNLDKASLIAIAESILGGSLNENDAEKLATASECNPLFMVESLRMLLDCNSLIIEDNEWRLATRGFSTPSKIKDIIIQRISCLNNAQRRILDAASVIGEKFNVELLSSVLEEDSLDVMQTLNVIAHRTSLVNADENHYMFNHSRSREVIYESLDPPLKIAYHKRTAEKLESIKNAELPLSDLAYHFAKAGKNKKAIKYALAAGKEALAKWSNLEAIEHFKYVLQNFQGARDEERVIALEGLGDAYTANCMYSEAIKTFDELASRETGAVKLRAFRKAMDAAFAKGDQPDRLIEYARKAQELEVSDRLEMARVINNRAKAFGWARGGSIKPDLADYDAALKVFEEENSLSDIAEALWRSGVLCTTFEEQKTEAFVRLLRSIAIFNEQRNIRKQIEATLNTGSAFFFLGLFSEAEEQYSKALKIGEKLDAFTELAQANAFLGIVLECEGKIEDALNQTLSAIELWKKTDANWMQVTLYAILIRQYCKLGDLKHADEYFDKSSKLPQEIARKAISTWGTTYKGVFYAAKAEWEQAIQNFDEALLYWDKTPLTGLRILARKGYIQALELQGRFEEAKGQLNEIQKIHRQATQLFCHANVKVNLMAPRNVTVGEEFEMRLDLVNISKNPATLIKLEGLIPENSKVTSLPAFCRVQGNTIVIVQRKMLHFQVDTFKFHMVLSEDGIYNFEPVIYYLDDLSTIKENKSTPIKITATYGSKQKKESIAKFGFNSEAAEKVFNFLLQAYEEDYLSRRLQQEKSGWRTLMETVKSGSTSKHFMYGRSGKGGKITQELEHLGLIEYRFFDGERGRTGRVLKIRVCIGNENIENLLTQKINTK
jgi:pentatricopeptide repeat protein